MPKQEYLTPNAAAAYIGSTENSLRWMRSKGGGPRFHVIGTGRSRIRYTRAALDEYVAGRTNAQIVRAETAATKRVEKQKGLTEARLSVRP